MRRTIYLPDELAARVDEYLEVQRRLHPDVTFSSLVQEALEQRIPSKRHRSILELAGLVDVDTFESAEKAKQFADRPEDQFVDRTR